MLISTIKMTARLMRTEKPQSLRFPPFDGFIQIGDGVAGRAENFNMVVCQPTPGPATVAAVAATRNGEFIQFDGEVAGSSGSFPSSSSSSSSVHNCTVEDQPQEGRGGHSPGWIRCPTRHGNTQHGTHEKKSQLKLFPMRTVRRDDCGLND